MHCWALIKAVGREVSIRARHVCRAMPFYHSPGRREAEVSIRARHVCRAMRGARSATNDDRLFQSAPGTCAGRCASNFQQFARRWLFQSAPGTCAGRCVVRHRLRVTRWRFNPRPARVPGDATSLGSVANKPVVSIRARHVCRAMPGFFCRTDEKTHVSIRARHVCRAMQASGATRIKLWWFQSAPGTCAGRCRLS